MLQGAEYLFILLERRLACTRRYYFYHYCLVSTYLLRVGEDQNLIVSVIHMKPVVEVPRPTASATLMKRVVEALKLIASATHTKRVAEVLKLIASAIHMKQVVEEINLKMGNR